MTDRNIISVNPLVDTVYSLPSKQRKLPSVNPYKYLAGEAELTTFNNSKTKTQQNAPVPTMTHSVSD